MRVKDVCIVFRITCDEQNIEDLIGMVKAQCARMMPL
ncbi:hypothetical protein ACB092_05G170300 [Castanea dentata]